MKFAFVVDPLDHLKAYKDSSVAMMREAARRGHEVHALQAGAMFLDAGRVLAPVQRLELHADDASWYTAGEARDRDLGTFDVVMMRKDPPFDAEYYYATLLLEQVEAAGTRVVNRPRALRDWNEKLAILRFPQFTPPTLVASDPQRLQAFIEAQRDVILKKLDGMGGTMIFRVGASDANRNVIVETMTDLGRRTVMAQRFVPEISQGDKRVLVVGGRVIDHCLARIPKAGETRGNLAQGGIGRSQPVSKRDREIGEAVGRELVKDGIVFAGLDVIGDCLTEVNVTSPTGIVEIANQAGTNAAKDLLELLERRSP